MTMQGLSLATVVMFSASVILQVIGISIMPMTKGLTEPLYTTAFAACYIVAIGLLARITHAGVNISLLIPLVTAVIPLCSVAVGILVYGDSASPMRVALLVGACLMVGTASVV
jgi:multidrug transporter EmrE-like cation transporter